jgi:hypothetical protein
MDINVLLNGLLKKGGGRSGVMESPYRSIILAAVVIVLFILAFVFLFYLPRQEENARREKELQERQAMEKNIGSLKNQSGKLKKNLNKSRGYYDTVLSYFGNSEDLRDLYQSVSLLASRHNMLVVNIKEIPVPVAAVDKEKGKKKKAKKEEKPKAAAKKKGDGAEKTAPKIVKEIRVKLELKGKFPHYMAFKKALSEAPLLLSIHTEKVKVEDEVDKKQGSTPESRGNMSVTLELSSYAIDKAAYQKTLDSYEEEQKVEAKKEKVIEEVESEEVQNDTAATTGKEE